MTDNESAAISNALLDMYAARDVLSSCPSEKDWDIRAAEVVKALTDSITDIEREFST